MAENEKVVPMTSGTNAINNTVTIYETPSGVSIELTLNFLLLYKVKAEYPNAYERYNNVIMKGMKDVFDGIAILYTAYLCANVGKKEKAMPYDEFIGLMGDDIFGVMKQAGELIGRKKKAGSGTRS